MVSMNDLKLKTDQVLENLNPIQHLNHLDYPRRVGTKGEQKAAAYIKQVLEQTGYEPFIQEFKFAKPKVLPKLVIPIILVVWTILSLANLQFWENNPIISIFVLTLPLVLILVMLNIDQVMMYFFGRQRRKILQVAQKIEDGTLSDNEVITSQNIIAEIGPKDADRQVLFTAHYDSISSKVPIRLMNLSAILGMIGLVIYSLLYLFQLLPGISLELSFNFLTIFALILLTSLEIFFLARLFRGNESHGIIDDGTGVAILLELTKFMKTHEIPGYRFTFGFFSAEESGLIGSAYFYMNHIFDKTKLHVISIDMIGERAPLSYVKGIYPIRRRLMNPGFNEQIASIARRLEIEIKGKTYPYPGSDFGHFMLDGGCKTNWLISGSRLIHSKTDNLDNVNETLVKDALKLMVAYLLELENSMS